MSTLNSIFSDLLSLFFPSTCLGCGKLIERHHDWICLDCRYEIPLTDFSNKPENTMAVVLKESCPLIVNATAYFHFHASESWRKLIHDIKYRHSWRTALRLGRMFGHELAESPLYQDIDLVIPIPLHPRRQISRGYNQSEIIARGISKVIAAPLNVRAVRRSQYNESQVHSPRSKRWDNVSGIFSVKHPKALEGKHILLVDDVFTTGATAISCAETILAAVPSCHISVAALAFAGHSIFNAE